MFFLAIGMYLVTFDLTKKKIGAGANFGEGGPEKQLFLPWPIGLSCTWVSFVWGGWRSKGKVPVH